MITGMEQTVEPPSLRKRKWGLLLDIAEDITIPRRKQIVAPGEDTPLPAGIQSSSVPAGITFIADGCDGLEVTETEFCADTASENPVGFDTPLFEAFTIRSTAACSALDSEDVWLQGRVNRRWDAFLSAAVAHELMVGGSSGASPSFASTATVYQEDSVDPLVGLALVEFGLGEALHGAEGLIHVPPALVPLIAVALERDGDQWRTLTGHRVVSDAGYPGSAPVGQDPDEGTFWIYGSGQVGYKLGPPRPADQDAVEYLDRTRNTVHARKLADAVVAFDPCAVTAAQVNVMPTGS